MRVSASSRVLPPRQWFGETGAAGILAGVPYLAPDGKRYQGVLQNSKLFNLRTKASNSKGLIKQTLKMKKAGILVFTPIASKACNTKRVGVTNVFTPPVTG